MVLNKKHLKLNTKITIVYLRIQYGKNNLEYRNTVG